MERTRRYRGDARISVYRYTLQIFVSDLKLLQPPLQHRSVRLSRHKENIDLPGDQRGICVTTDINVSGYLLVFWVSMHGDVRLRKHHKQREGFVREDMQPAGKNGCSSLYGCLGDVCFSFRTIQHAALAAVEIKDDVGSKWFCHCGSL